MPFTADAIAAQHVQERLKSLHQLVVDVEKKRMQSENGCNAINKLQNTHEDRESTHYQVTAPFTTPT